MPASGQPPTSHPGVPSLNASQKAERYLLQKRFREAVAAYTVLLEQENPRDFRGLVRAYQGLGQLSDAEGVLRQWLTTHPASSAGSYALGYVFYLRERNAAAEKYFIEALEYDSKNTLALNNWGALLAQEKFYAEAVEKVKRAIQLDPLVRMYYQNLKTIYGQMGEPDKFDREFRDHLQSGRSKIAAGYGHVMARSLRQEGFRLYSQGQVEQTIKKFEKVTDIYGKIGHPAGLVAALFSLGLLFEETGDEDSAAHYFEEVLKINPDHIQARQKLKPRS